MTSARAVIVLDADPALSGLLVDVLTDEGFVVHSVNHQQELYETIIQTGPFLLILDAHMPGLSLPSLRQMCQNQQVTLPPILALSTDQEHGKRMLLDGATLHLPKPFDLDTLVDIVYAHQSHVYTHQSRRVPAHVTA